jgi:hypothetical protein
MRRPGESIGWSVWWAHLEFTRINTTPTILYKRIEDLREAGPVELDVAGFEHAEVGVRRVRRQVHVARSGPNPNQERQLSPFPVAVNINETNVLHPIELRLNVEELVRGVFVFWTDVERR